MSLRPTDGGNREGASEEETAPEVGGEEGRGLTAAGHSLASKDLRLDGLDSAVAITFATGCCGI